jgi:hypothetical protein
MHIGIDNGLNGGIVALSDVERVSAEGRYLAPIAKIPMPTLKRKRKAKGKGKPPKYEREVDTAKLIAFIRDELHVTPKQPCVFHIEQCPRHSRDKSAMRVMAFTYGKIIGILEAAFPYCELKRVRSGNDTDGWQRALLPDMKPGQSKAEALKLAKQLWPEEDWRASERCEVSHDGMIDGALIAFFGRRKVIGGQTFLK